MRMDKNDEGSLIKREDEDEDEGEVEDEDINELISFLRSCIAELT